ncbi:hypothetical protein AB0H00_17860 [Nocardia sp. NPDC023852]|uniref:hypothetical protein n=1 Tax=Nocardia sp. NPDC023852 TaxID=3154697 RepID=UPI00340ECC20
MSNNEIDEIGRDTGRVFRQVIDVARTYIQRRRDHGRNAGVPRLTRTERRELAEQIRMRVGEQRVTEAWFTKRVEDYRRESIALRQRMRRTAGLDMDAENARLNAMRYGIESNLPGTGLSLEQRGQIVQAMDRFDCGAVDRPFYGPELFGKPVGRAAVEARDAAVRSERWVAGRRAAIEQVLPNDRERAVREAAVRAVDPEQAIRQGVAVQDLRHVQAVAREYSECRDVRSGRRLATARARAAGLTPEQIRWELDNAEANSRTQVTVTVGRPGEKDRTWYTYHPTEAAAAQWTHDGVTEIDWRPGTTLTVKAREDGNPKPFYAVEGNQVTVGRDLELWHSETRDGFTHAQQQEPTREQHAHTAASHNDLAIEHSRIAAERDQLRGNVDSLQTRLNLSIGHNSQLDEQNSQLVRQLTALTAERDRLRVEHKAMVTATASRGREVYALSQQCDRLRGERDEAVQKLAERTPAQERYGSPERQAEHAKTAAELVTKQDQRLAALNETMQRIGVPEETRNGFISAFEPPQEARQLAEQAKASASAGRSALADHQPGRTLADAVARSGAERDRTER